MRSTTGFHPFALRPEHGDRTTFRHYCIHGNMVEVTSQSLMHYEHERSLASPLILKQVFREHTFSNYQAGTPPRSYPMDGALSPGQSDRGAELTTHLCLVQRFKKRNSRNRFHDAVLKPTHLNARYFSRVFRHTQTCLCNGILLKVNLH